MSDMADKRAAEESVLERIATLEGRIEAEQKSFTRKFSQWIALLALVVSIAVGGFQVYENVILRKQEKIDTNRSLLAGYVQTITELNSKIVSIHYSIPDRAATQALAKVLNIEKLSIMGLADDFLSRHEEIASYASVFTLSSEHLHWGNTAKARLYSELALKLATTDIERVEALRIEARTWFAPGNEQNIARARKKFKRAIEIVASSEFFGKASLFANVYADWIGSEAAFGDCEMARNLFPDFEKAIKQEYGGADILYATKSQIATTLGSKTSCNIF